MQREAQYRGRRLLRGGERPEHHEQRVARAGGGKMQAAQRIGARVLVP